MRTVLFVLLVMLAVPAWGQDTKVDIAPFVNNVVWPVLTAAVLALGTWAVQRLAKWLGIQNEATLQSSMDKLLRDSLAFAQSRIAGPLTIDVKSRLVAEAASFAVDHGKDILSSASVTPDLLREKLEAKISLNTTPPAESAAVPNPTPAVTIQPASGRIGGV